MPPAAPPSPLPPAPPLPATAPAAALPQASTQAVPPAASLSSPPPSCAEEERLLRIILSDDAVLHGVPAEQHPHALLPRELLEEDTEQQLPGRPAGVTLKSRGNCGRAAGLVTVADPLSALQEPTRQAMAQLMCLRARDGAVVACDPNTNAFLAAFCLQTGKTIYF